MDNLSFAGELSTESGFAIYVYDQSCEKTHVEAKKSIHETSEVTLQGNRTVSSILDVVTVKELDGTPPFIGLGNLRGQLSAHDATSGDKIPEPKRTESCGEFCLSAPLDVNKKKTLSKCATFPSPVEADVIGLSSVGVYTAESTDLRGQCALAATNTIYSRSISLPASSKLLSALKGSRAQNGLTSNIKLHVKWAPEVYDPPCTIMSHTVKKNHIQRPKAKKRDGNKSKRKSKSIRGTNPERRTANKSSLSNIVESMDISLQNSGDALLQNGYAKTSMESVDYAVSNQDSKCGSSFLREAIAKVHISITEVRDSPSGVQHFDAIRC